MLSLVIIDREMIKKEDEDLPSRAISILGSNASRIRNMTRDSRICSKSKQRILRDYAYIVQSVTTKATL
jgi:hypothetical protein